MSRVSIRAKHIPPFMNFNYWVELDGEFISNELDLAEAEHKAQKCD